MRLSTFHLDNGREEIYEEYRHNSELARVSVRDFDLVHDGASQLTSIVVFPVSSVRLANLTTVFADSLDERASSMEACLCFRSWRSRILTKSSAWYGTISKGSYQAASLFSTLTQDANCVS